MIRKILLSVAMLPGVGFGATARANQSAPASDNPLAGLNLGDSSGCGATNAFSAKFEKLLVVLNDGRLENL